MGDAVCALIGEGQLPCGLPATRVDGGWEADVFGGLGTGWEHDPWDGSLS